MFLIKIIKPNDKTIVSMKIPPYKSPNVHAGPCSSLNTVVKAIINSGMLDAIPKILPEMKAAFNFDFFWIFSMTKDNEIDPKKTPKNSMRKMNALSHIFNPPKKLFKVIMYKLLYLIVKDSI
jgi:hypothetical protein